ncbi:DUF2779 domain-containing protein [Pseudobdellovibrio exovorus]|uniref:DUF2779 domain-containing protein n=1 Tax=Pseudobdellovibrio exovorus JSS TaxID=1184267 RepID=M4VQ25_9BACT|nr:DUF2779 domain-containing protein [Pseudobdellovibrio exovorus]AGH95249.1 hypothetical protein A11Q_1033 [Pseudobdellovibrio exovorus JSS]
MANLPKLISKTKIMQGYQCHKQLYLSVHRKELIPPVTPELQALFDQGNHVTEEARKRFPSGVLIDNPAFDFVGSLKKTRELLSAHTETIFEAAFEYKGCYARADIISYNPLTQRWIIREVKSTTKVKDEHLDDVGLQVWIMANAGLPIEKIVLMHLNPLCKYPDLRNLFVEEDITDKLRGLHTSIAPRLNEVFKSLRAEQVPAISIGEHCYRPRECQFKDHCWAENQVPDLSVFDIPTLRQKKWEFCDKGLLKLDDIPESELDHQQQIFLNVLKTGNRFIDRERIHSELAKWKFPLVFLDFETQSSAIPRFDGTGPFAQVPFQFSVHVLDSLDSELRHYEYLCNEDKDPREELTPLLIEACRGVGSVVAYYSQFEAGRIQDLEDYFPHHKEELKSIRDRLVDPLPLLREAVYDRAFRESFSIKSVGPALLGDVFDYKAMTVPDGGAAQRAYAEMVDSKTSGARREVLRNALLEYCAKDTLVMVELVKWLYKC